MQKPNSFVSKANSWQYQPALGRQIRAINASSCLNKRSKHFYRLPTTPSKSSSKTTPSNRTSHWTQASFLKSTLLIWPSVYFRRVYAPLNLPARRHDCRPVQATSRSKMPIDWRPACMPPTFLRHHTSAGTSLPYIPCWLWPDRLNFRIYRSHPLPTVALLSAES